MLGETPNQERIKTKRGLSVDVMREALDPVPVRGSQCRVPLHLHEIKNGP